MAISKQKITVQKTAHYHTYGTLSKETKYIWIALHGYGQLSKRLINKFSILDEKDHFVVAPDGLNRFYWHGNNEPVSNWMTKEDRYDEINDYVRYLDQIYAMYCAHVNQEKVKIILFGFSQGSMAMWRWLHASQPRYDMTMTWGGWISEDISYLHIQDYLSAGVHHHWYGDEDEYVTTEKKAELIETANQNNITLKTHVFKGGHRIAKEVLSQFVQQEVEI